MQHTPDHFDSPGTKQELQRYRDLVEHLFNPQWLASGSAHRVQKLWARQDGLARLEIASLGFAMEALAPHRQWLTKAIRTAKGQPDGAHGHLFEILLLGALAAGGMELRPKRTNAPGYDAEIILGDGHVLRASIKNHDLSTHEAAFRAGCERLNDLVKERVRQAGGSWSVRAFRRGNIDRAMLQALTETMRVVPLVGAGGQNQVADATLLVSPLARPNVLPGSHQLVVFSAAHDLEQLNFRRKLARAIEDFARHSPRGNSYSNVVFMRVHATANLDAMEEVARRLLAEPDCVVDAVYFQQSAVTREDGGWVVSYCVPKVASARFERVQADVRLLQLAGRPVSRPSRLQLQTAGGIVDMSGHYLFQRGDLYYGAAIGETLTLPSHGAGLRSWGVYTDHEGNSLNLTARVSDDDELLAL